VAFTPDAGMLATSGLGGEIQIWSLPAGEHLETIAGHKTAVPSLAFVQEGRYLMSLGYEGTLKFWDTGTWQAARTLGVDDPRARGVALSPDEQVIAVSVESEVQLLTLEDWQLMARLPVSTKVVNGMAFSSDGQWLAAGAADRKIRVWEMR
jgi:WD40 repeat protein